MMKLVLAGAVMAGLGALPAMRTATPVTTGVMAVMAQDSAAGKAIFTGKGNCFACHGPDAKGTPLAPDLTDAKWLNIDGSLAAIVKLVKEGVAAPKEHPAPMPAMGGATLTDKELQSVASYVFSLSHKK
jgi:mono/diheme cytochrome c family protein